MKSKTILLALIVIIASFFRLYQLTTVPPGLYQDEAMDGNNALENIHTGTTKVFYTEDNGREGLYVNIVTALIEFTGVHEPWVVRLPAAVFGILTVLGLYFLVAELFGTNAGLLSAFILATNFWHINFSRIGFRAIAAPFFLAWAIYFLIKAVCSENPPHAALWAGIGGITYGLGFSTYIAYRITPLLLLLFIPYFRKKPYFKRSVAAFIAATILVALPIGIYFLKHPADFLGRTSQVSVFSSPAVLRDLALNIVKTLGMFNVAGDYNWRHNVSGRPELSTSVGILFLVGLFLGIRGLFRSLKNRAIFEARNFGGVMLVLWFALAALPVVISNEGIPHALRAILMAPPAIVWAALGGIAIYELLGKYISAYWRRGLVALFVGLCVAQAYASYFIVWASNANVPGSFNTDYVAIGHEINALPANIPKYVVVEASGVDVRGIPMPAQPVMYITDTFGIKEQQAKNVYYLLPEDAARIPRGAHVFYLR